MIKHGKKIIVTVGAVSALAFGGAALASAGLTPGKPAAQPSAEQTSAPDRDSIQSGDQSKPDTQRSEDSEGSAEQPETAAEAPGSEVPNNDGPGGHADRMGRVAQVVGWERLQPSFSGEAAGESGRRPLG